MTRATGSLLRADVGASVRHHPYLVVLAVQVVVLAGIWAAGSEQIQRRARSWMPRLALINAVALVAVWLTRMALGHIPAPFL
jgi:hypothetical protein